MKPWRKGMAERGAGGVGTPSPRAPPPYQEGLVGTLADDGVIRAVHGGLAREAGIELADVLLRLLRGGGGTRLPSSELPPPPSLQPHCPPEPPRYQAGFEGRVQAARQQLLPVDVPEEGMLLQEN